MDTYTPAEVTSAMITLGERKAKQAYHITFFKAWFAAWFLGFGGMIVQTIQGGSGTLRTDYPGLISVISAFFFPVGLIALVMTGQELCTANFMVLPMACIKRRIPIWHIAVNWLIVFFGNLAGALCYDAFLAHYSGLYTPGMVTYSQAVAVAKVSETWGGCVLRGIGCNFLVCLAIWLGATCRDGISKVVCLHFPIFTFVLLGFEHVIVNMIYVPIGMLNGASVDVGTYIGRSMIPSLIGNILGALLLGIPMLLFFNPPELPFFNKNRNSSDPETVVVHDNQDSGSGTITGEMAHAKK